MQLKRSPFLNYLLKKVKLDYSKEYIHASTENINEGVDVSGPNLWVLAAAILVASLGLNINSTAVIIGAMLISPIMGPIMGLGLGLGTSDMALVAKAVRNYIVSVIISITASTIYFLISPVKIAGTEIVARTSPTIYDVLIALFGGLAGIIASSSKLSKSNVIPGVAIATALMPPLCTVGYGIANQNKQFIIGSVYLFFINTIFICLSTYIIVRVLKYPYVHINETRHSKRIRFAIWSIVIFSIIPSIYLTYNIVQKYVFETAATDFIQKEVAKNNQHFVISRKLSYNNGNPKIELTMLGKEMDSTYQQTLKKRLRRYGLRNADLMLISADESNHSEGLFNNINNGLELNAGSIQDIYSRLDSLQTMVAMATQRDTLSQHITLEAKAQLPTLNHFAVTPSVSYNYNKYNYDTLWIVRVSFDRYPTNANLQNFRTWIANRLHTTNFQLLINR